MTRLHCPLPDCGWSVLRPELPDLDPELSNSMDALVAATRDMHVNRHGPRVFARKVAAAAPGHRQGHTLHVVCPVTGCRWERDIDLSLPGFWASLFMPGPEVMAMSVHAERNRHLTRHDTTVLARTLEHLTPKDTTDV